MTDTIDSSSLNITGIATFSNTTQSISPTTGALIVKGGLGIEKQVILVKVLLLREFSTLH